MKRLLHKRIGAAFPVFNPQCCVTSVITQQRAELRAPPSFPTVCQSHVSAAKGRRDDSECRPTTIILYRQDKTGAKARQGAAQVKETVQEYIAGAETVSDDPATRDYVVVRARLMAAK